MDRRAHQHAEADAYDQGEQQADERVNAHIRHAVGDDHSRKGRYGADRQVDTACDQHHRHTDRADAVIRVLCKHTDDQRTQGQEAFICIIDSAEDIDDQKDPDGRVDHDIFRIHDTGEKTLFFTRCFFHILVPPFLNSA